MKIAIASGKGGTGKTTVAVNLAAIAQLNGKRSVYVDCDVEEPNGHIFLKPEIDSQQTVTNPVPVIDDEKCDSCGECGKICHFNAIAVILDSVLVFPELCHGCGGCFHACPKGAITESPREVGKIEAGRSYQVEASGKEGIGFIHGILNLNEAMAVPVIRAVRKMIPESEWVVIDAPPGTSCSMVATVRDADYVLLVTEPTPFGLHDLELAYRTVRDLDITAGVVVNRAGTGDSGVGEFCAREGIEILAEIPESREIAEIYSRGSVIINEDEGFASIMAELMKKVEKRIMAEQR
ncbi:MAG: ATP-binding protein [Candidatus Krumholzibacteriota bacterium]|nr:ATP-binding protein [Candidatus Krumholzibacteriota bacterium]